MLILQPIIWLEGQSYAAWVALDCMPITGSRPPKHVDLE